MGVGVGDGEGVGAGVVPGPAVPLPSLHPASVIAAAAIANMADRPNSVRRAVEICFLPILFIHPPFYGGAIYRPHCPML